MKDKKNKSTEAKTYKFDTLSLHAGYQHLTKMLGLDKCQFTKQPHIYLMM